MQPFADWIHSWPELFSEAFIDNHDRLSLTRIVFVEITSALQRRAHRFEISGRYGDSQRSEDRLSRTHLVPLGEDGVLIEAPSKRDTRCRTCEAHAGYRTNLLESLIHERLQFFGRVFDLGKSDGNGDDAFALESRIYAKEIPEAGEQQSGA